MMSEQEQPGPRPDDAEQKEKKEASEKSAGQDDPEQLRKQVAAERARNDKLEKTVNQEEGNEAGERRTGRERLNEIIRQNLQVIMQQELGFNENTDFSRMETGQLRQLHSLLQQSRAYVSSHNADSLSRSGAMAVMLKTAFEQYKKENPGDATGGGLQNAGREEAAAIFREALLSSLDAPEKKINEELKNRNVDVEGEREKRESDGEQLRVVRGTPNDRDFTPGSRNGIRDFRNAIQIARAAPDGKTYNQLMFEGPQNDDDKAAVRKLNVLAKKFDDAVAHCSESGVPAADKNARAQALRDYSADMLRNPADTPESLPDFKDWITQNADKFKAAQERARKTAE